ncbi:helix-turn-helix domain-containing protein [Emcibacter nanhaiensis]|uniref:Helix-turn-helix domain-containing protein n=1 Tax=Emcibacter nanhaiensis TaxID=1505037 RepID=A0A501PP52_9PROT|nr:XRE family transcriptional regulator [Emcibacter nanhaiensis]TPD61541.1 helix-turn-helix domain-containing protein [Emcibacter nanhaiensis]
MSRHSPPDVGSKIKELRSARQMTLEQLARASGVSKSMLSQIERGRTNPTVATLWSLTAPLGIDLADLLDSKGEDQATRHEISVLPSHQCPAIQSADGKCSLRILGPIDLVSQMEWYDMQIEPGGILESEPHSAGTREHITVLEGALRISNGLHQQDLAAGDTARYEADIPHAIENIGKSKARAMLVVIAG